MMKFLNSALECEPRLREVEARNFSFKYIFNAQTDTMYYSGSKQDGFGDRYSDIDIYMLCEDNQIPADDEIMLPILGVKFGYNIYNDEKLGYWVEMTPYSMSWARNTIRKINSIALDDYESISNLSYREYDMYYRLVIGTPIVNSKVFYDVQGKTSKEHICRVLSIRKGINAAKNFNYAKLLVGESEYEQAYYYAQAAVEYAIDHYLCNMGEGYPGGKVKFRKMERLWGKDSEFEKKATKMIGLGGRQFRDYCIEAFDFCEQCGISQFMDLPCTRISTVKYSINGEIHLFELGNKYCMHNGTEVFEIDSIAEVMLRTLQERECTKEELKMLIEDYQGGTAGTKSLEFIESAMKQGIIKEHIIR